MREDMDKVVDGVSKTAILDIATKELLVKSIRILQWRPDVLRICAVPPDLPMEPLRLLAHAVHEAPKDLNTGVISSPDERLYGDKLPDFQSRGIGSDCHNAADGIAARDERPGLGHLVRTVGAAEHPDEVGVGGGCEYLDGEGTEGGRGEGMGFEGDGVVFVEDEAFHFAGESHDDGVVRVG